jgi:outer membrane immunogenic protein
MKKFLLGTAGLVALSMAAPASAADMAARPYTKAPPPMVAAMYDWSGFYLGLNGGWGSARKCWDNVDLGVAVAEGCHDASGGTVGGQIGYRWQAASWVFGLEAQGNWADFDGSNASLIDTGLGVGATSNRSRIDAFGLFTGQVGYAWNNFLLYVKGGAAVTSDKYEGYFTGTNVVFDTASETRWGAVVGVGAEYSFTPNWSFGVEYNHLFMGDRDITLTDGAGLISRTDSISQDVDMVTARINYRWGGPVVARY